MLAPEIEKALNDQINQELAASYMYMAMAAYMDKQNLTGFASWMTQQSDEERTHAHRIFRFVLDRNGTVNLEAIQKPASEFGSVIDVVRQSLAAEQKNTRAIYQLYDLARQNQDYATVSHLQWFLDEQVEEEKLFNDLLGRLELAAGEKTALLIIDDQLSKRTAAE